MHWLSLPHPHIIPAQQIYFELFDFLEHPTLWPPTCPIFIPVLIFLKSNQVWVVPFPILLLLFEKKNLLRFLKNILLFFIKSKKEDFLGGRGVLKNWENLIKSMKKKNHLLKSLCGRLFFIEICWYNFFIGWFVN